MIVLTLGLLPAAYEPPPLAEIAVAADGYAVAERLDPPAPPPVDTAPSLPGSSSSAGGRCVGWEGLLSTYSPGWNVERMSRIMYRESRCRPEVRNDSSGSTGLLQLMPMHCRWLDESLSESCSVVKLQTARFNVQAAAALWRVQGYQAWVL